MGYVLRNSGSHPIQVFSGSISWRAHLFLMASAASIMDTRKAISDESFPEAFRMQDYHPLCVRSSVSEASDSFVFLVGSAVHIDGAQAVDTFERQVTCMADTV
jgi:hypothetical protein